MNSVYPVAVVTALLKRHIENWVARRGLGALLGADVTVSALPPDRITTGTEERPQLNIFLYHLAPNAALRNERNGRSGTAVDLYYLVSAYGAADLHVDVLIGCAVDAMRRLAALDADGIQSLAAALLESGHGLVAQILGGENPVTQFERLMIVPQFLNVEETSQLWSAVQAPIRPSVAYRVSAVTVAEREERA